jgi:elongator complex protein 3
MTKDFIQLAEGLTELSPLTAKDLAASKRRLAKKFSLPLPTNAELITAVRRSSPNQPALLKLLKRRAVRTLSGIAPVAVLTKPFPCPGQCAYCPTDKNIPQSYLATEPAVMRAVHCGFDPYRQVIYRLKALEANGHEPAKIELIVIGGTWSALPAAYQLWFIKECFRAANNYGKKSQTTNSKSQTNHKSQIPKLKKQLLLEQKKNEKAKYKIVGLTLETRPDYINEAEMWQMRELGATRVEIGVQALDDKILKLNRRRSTVADIKQATKLLKNFGFKVTYHFMPALPGSSPAHDRQMFQAMFSPDQDTANLKLRSDATTALKKLINRPLTNNDFNPDQIKFYPTMVTKGSLLYDWWHAGKYQPYTDAELKKLIIDCKKIVPPFVRIIRLIRDIPGESIVAGNKITNLRQIIKAEGARCRCIRCREVGNGKFKAVQARLFISKYRASESDEYFISFANADQSKLYGFARLRLAAGCPLKQTALLRELHVYGELVPVGSPNAKIQHRGLGQRLMKQAETIARLAGYRRLAVISGVGVRNYYRKLGYRLAKTYLVKAL